MGIADRHYMQEGGRRGPWSVTAILIGILVAAFAIQCINDVYIHAWRVEELLALTPAAIKSGYVWQFFTFQFFHVGILHLLGNLLGLWCFGRFIENVLGRQRFLIAYFGCGVMGGLLQAILMVLFPAHFGSFVFGASAGGLGLLAIFCRLESTAQIRWNFIIPIRADVLLWITAAVSLFFTIVPSIRGGGTAHAAHLGGLLAGVAWVHLGWHRDFVTLPWENLASRWRLFRNRDRKRELIRAASVPRRPGRKATDSLDVETPSEEFISAKVDPILDKISAHGIQSLTEQERKILDAARKKMAKR